MTDTKVPSTFTSWLKKIKGGGMKGGADDSVTFGSVALENVLATTDVEDHYSNDNDLRSSGFNIMIGTGDGVDDIYTYNVKVCVSAISLVRLSDDERMHLNIFLIIAVLSWHILALNDRVHEQKTRLVRQNEIEAKIEKVVKDFCELYNAGKKTRRST